MPQAPIEIEAWKYFAKWTCLLYRSLPKWFRYSSFRYSINKKLRRRPFFRYYSEFRYLGFRYSSRYLYYPLYTIFIIKTSQFVGSPTCGVCACCGGHSGPFCECPPNTKTEGGFSSEDGCRQVKTILDKNNVTRPRIGQVGTFHYQI